MDNREDLKSYPVLAYGLDDGVLLIWNDGSHTLEPEGKVLPKSNWIVWDYVDA